jgi:hypothetical protein
MIYVATLITPFYSFFLLYLCDIKLDVILAKPVQIIQYNLFLCREFSSGNHIIVNEFTHKQ